MSWRSEGPSQAHNATIGIARSLLVNVILNFIARILGLDSAAHEVGALLLLEH